NIVEDIAVSEQSTLAGVEAVLTDYKVGGSKDHVNALLTIFSGPVGRYATQAWYNLDLPQIMAGSNVESQASTYWDTVQGAAYGEIVMELAPAGLKLTPTTEAFTTAYEARAGKYPTYTAFGAYESVNILKEALERLSSYNAATITEDLQAELGNTDYYGPRARIRFTNEPLQQGVNSTGDPIDIPGADVINGGMDVHDTWTSVAGNAPPYNLTDSHVIFGQWHESGVKTTVWGQAVLPAAFALKAFNPANPFDNDSMYWSAYNNTPARAYCNYLGGHYPDDLRNMLNWTEFDHSDHGWTSEPTTTTEPPTGPTTTTTTATATTTTTTEREVPGFTLPLLLLLVGTIVAKRRTKRK
ncbi:MAG: hypothetical protein ACXAB2_11735, partial [Candidatus Hodarchaeales archaeon]